MKVKVAAMGLVLAGCVGLLACGDDDSEADENAAEATCEIMATIEGPDDITLQKLDDLLAVAPPEIESELQLIRDEVGSNGAGAYENPEVGAAFEEVGGFEERTCS